MMLHAKIIFIIKVRRVTMKISCLRTRVFVLVIVTGICVSSSASTYQNPLESSATSSSQLAKVAEELALSQDQVRNEIELKTREKYAQESSYWANVARDSATAQATQVMEITRKAQDAQILSLKFGSITSRLKSSVLSAQLVFDSAFERYKILSTLSKEAENHSSKTADAANLLQHVLRIRENWATEERARALRLSQQLQNILYDLKLATSLSQSSNEYAFLASQNNVYKNLKV